LAACTPAGCGRPWLAYIAAALPVAVVFGASIVGRWVKPPAYDSAAAKR
jgi:hypothetical protein